MWVVQIIATQTGLYRLTTACFGMTENIQSVRQRWARRSFHEFLDAILEHKKSLIERRVYFVA